jgi:predicted nucleic acid-binding protein
MTLPAPPYAAILDASFVVAICAKESDKEPIASPLMTSLMAAGGSFHAPAALVSEVLYVLCKKLQEGKLSTAEHAKALDSLEDICALLSRRPDGDAPLFRRADAIRAGHTCRLCADGLYVALAEQVAQQERAVLITFDDGQERMAKREAPTVTVMLLVPITPPKK